MSMRMKHDDKHGQLLSNPAIAAAVQARVPSLRAFLEPDEIVVDQFAGGGGASEGLEEIAESVLDSLVNDPYHRALIESEGRQRMLRELFDVSPDIAINHDPEAIAMHKANHPECKHYIEDVFKVDPVVACGGRRVGLMWLSPTCTHFSKAKGTALDESSIKLRGLCWVGTAWAAAVKPRIICLENVEEFAKFGPLHRQHTDGCKGVKCVKGCTFGKKSKNKRAKKSSKRHIEGCPGVACSKKCKIYKPIKAREGELFRAFVSRLEKLGYKVEWKILRACDYGAPTTRRRLFLVARRDGKPIVWPEPTHGPGRKFPYRTAAECIDWSIPCPSIFERDKDLAEKTLARIARGIQKFVLENPRPFIVPPAYGDKGGKDVRVNDVDEPLRTICGTRGGHAIVTPVLIPATHGDKHGAPDKRSHSVEEPVRTLTTRGAQYSLAVPYLVHRSNGERREVVVNGKVRKGQAPRIYDANKPLSCVVAGGIKHGAAVALLIKNNGGNNDACGASGQPLDRAMDTVSCRDSKAVTVASLVKFRGTSDSHVSASAHGLDEPMPTVTASGTHVGAVAAFLVRYNGKSLGQCADTPTSTIDCKDRLGLVTVTIEGEEYIIADIGFRMLEPRELFNAQGFPPDYEICPEYEGKPLTKTAQIRMVGNSVPPAMSKVLARAQLEAN